MSRVIRGNGAAPRVVPGELAGAHAEAGRIVARAHDEAERILREARDGADRVAREARDDADRVAREARGEGLAAAHLEAARILLDAERTRRDALAGAERDVQALALAAASHIVGEAIAADPARVATIVREALARTRRATRLEIRVHPADVEALERGTLERPAHVVPDPEITRGGCVIRSELGVVDARLEVRLEAMARLLGCEST